MRIDFHTRRPGSAFSGSRVAALTVALALHIELAMLIFVPSVARERRPPASDYRDALVVRLYIRPGATATPASAVNRQQTAVDLRLVVAFPRPQRKTRRFTTAATRTAKSSPAAPAIRFAPAISLIPTRVQRLPSGETWAASLPGSAFVPGSARVIAPGFRFEPPGSTTLGGKIRNLVNQAQRTLFCSRVGLYASLPAGERDKVGLTRHELDLIHRAGYCN